LKADFAPLALRLTLAYFLFSLTLLFLYLVGASQNFLEPVQSLMFRGVRWLSWLGVLCSWFLLVPLNRRHGRQIVSSVFLGTGFLAIFGFVLAWGAWIYPESGRLPW